MNLKNKLESNLTLADYEKVEKYLSKYKNNLNKYNLVLILGGFGLGMIVGGMRRKNKMEREKQINNKGSNKNINKEINKEINKYDGSELERLVEKMIDRRYSEEKLLKEEERLLNDNSVDVKDYLEWCDKYKK